MRLNTLSAQVALSLLLGLIITGGVRAQDSFKSQRSLGIPDELRRFPVAENANRKILDLTLTDPQLKRFSSDHLSIKDVPKISEAIEGESSPQPAKAPGRSRAQSGREDNFRLAAALKQSLILLAIQHGFRMMQDKTSRELGGPFFEDWGRSVKGLRGWRDTDDMFTNYFAHPMQGAVTGRIYTTNSRDGELAEFGNSRKYWKSRLEALAWSTFWSAQFELGPISEATIGNVGMTKKNGDGTMGWVDIVITPTLGTALLVGEDAIEKYVLKRMLRDTGGRVTTGIKFWRSLLTPSMSFTNLLNGRWPWSRRSNFSPAPLTAQPGDTGNGSPQSKANGNRDK